MTKGMGVIALLVVAALALGGCGTLVRREPISRATRSEDRTPTEAFTRVEFSGYGDLTLEQGPEYRVEVRGEESVLEDLETSVDGDRLRIRMRPGRIGLFQDRFPLKVTITAPRIEQLDLSGATKASAREMTGTDFGLTISGAGKVDLHRVNFDSLRVEVSGAGEVNASGTVKRQDVQMSGAGHYEGRDLLTAETRIDMSGAGEASVAASETLDASVSGAGTVEYYGDPRVTEDTSGAGSVRHRG